MSFLQVLGRELPSSCKLCRAFKLFLGSEGFYKRIIMVLAILGTSHSKHIERYSLQRRFTLASQLQLCWYTSSWSVITS